MKVKRRARGEEIVDKEREREKRKIMDILILRSFNDFTRGHTMLYRGNLHKLFIARGSDSYRIFLIQKLHVI